MSAYSIKGGREHHAVEAPPKCSGCINSKSFNTLPSGIPKRYMRLVLAILISFAVWFSAHGSLGARSAKITDATTDPDIPYPQVQVVSNDTENNLPPLYESYRRYEDDLSEQNLRIQNASQRYIFFANQAWGCGWGNVLQEIVFNALLASEAKIGFVWDDYTWSKEGDYSTFNGKHIPSRIPISTMLAGHMLGRGPRSSEHFLPTSISSRTYAKICPPHEHTVIHRDQVQDYLHEKGSSIKLDSAGGDEILQAWVSYLTRPELSNSRCIEVKEGTLVAFDIWLLGSTRMHSLWNKLSQSTVLKNWSFSPLVRGMFEKNVAIFSPRADITSNSGILRLLWSFFGIGETQNVCTANDPPCITNSRLFNDSTPLPVLVLHLRRGDFKEHCSNLAEWNSTYTGFNSFPHFQVRDKFVPPSIGDANDLEYSEGVPTVVESMDDKKRVYVRHCFPDVSQIVRRVREVVHDYVRVQREKGKKEMEDRVSSRWWASSALNSKPRQRLEKVYIMTNGDPAWLAEVKKGLLDDLPERGRSDAKWEFDWTWEDISTSRDLRLGWEEKPVAQALDSYVASRAELFIGNGFSSLTSNIVMLRMNNTDFDPVQTRFW